jgi:glycosyltransferase involved in cell wall biosynthesis
LDAVKDPLTTLAGFALVLRHHPDAVLNLAWTDAPLHAEVLLAARPLGARVRLLGRLSRAGARALIGDADVLVQSSRREVCGIAVLEAMAAGTPPVVTAIPSFRAVLGDCGARFTPGDPAGLAAGVRAVLADPSQRIRCRARFERDLSFDALAERVGRVYRELV